MTQELELLSIWLLWMQDKENTSLLLLSTTLALLDNPSAEIKHVILMLQT